MNEFTNIKNGQELIVRKRIASFLEKYWRHAGYDFRHDIYKKIIYQEEGYNTVFEEKMKNYYDAYVYLLSNHKNPFTKEMLMKFFFIIDGKVIDQYLALKLASSFFDNIDSPPIEAAITYHLRAYEVMMEFEEEKKELVSLMLFNYTLLKHNIPTIQILKSDYPSYEIARKKYFEGDKTKMFIFFMDLFKNKAKFQDKSYYQNLKEITTKDIYCELKKDKDWLNKEFSIKSISIYGSFAKGESRIDSDIDLLVKFSEDLTRDEKDKNIEYLSRYYLDVFNHHIDITEVNEYLDDDFIKEITKVKKIF